MAVSLTAATTGMSQLSGSTRGWADLTSQPSLGSSPGKVWLRCAKQFAVNAIETERRHKLVLPTGIAADAAVIVGYVAIYRLR